jgi:hypothetical protein
MVSDRRGCGAFCHTSGTTYEELSPWTPGRAGRGELARGFRRRRHGRQLSAAAATIGPDPAAGSGGTAGGEGEARISYYR